MTTPSPTQPSSSRRGLLYAGIGAAAALAGASVALWKWSPQGEAKVDPTFWPMTFDTPDGKPLAMQGFRGKALLLNFWATWCPPCVEEMPLIDAFYRQNSAKNWQVVGLAIDQPSMVRSFLQKTPVTYPIGMAGLGGTELSKAMGNASGGLPFTVVINAAGEVVQRRMGRLGQADLSAWAQGA